METVGGRFLCSGLAVENGVYFFGFEFLSVQVELPVFRRRYAEGCRESVAEMRGA